MKNVTKEFKSFVKDYGKKFISIDRYNDLVKAIEELEGTEQSKDPRWKPEEGERFYYVDITVSQEPQKAKYDKKCAVYFRHGLGFQTEEQAQAHLDYLNAVAEVTDYIYEKGLQLDDVDWKDGKQYKYYPVFFHADKASGFEIDWISRGKQDISIPYLKSQEACEELIKEKKEALLVIFK